MERIIHYVFKYANQWWFDLRFKYYCWRYGGAKHIPGEVVGKLLGRMSDHDAKIIKFGVKLDKLTTPIGLDQETSVVCLEYGTYVRGEPMDAERRSNMHRLIESARTGRDILNALELAGDVTYITGYYRAVMCGKEHEFEQLLTTHIYSFKDQ
jgi:hypothetical protein